MSYPPITNFPADIIIAIRIKNIILTLKTHDIINTKDSPAAAIELVILLSVIGSSNAAESLKISDDSIILIIGYKIIKIITINPIDPIAFFIINEYPATDDIASEKDFPTIGIKLSTAKIKHYPKKHS